jgi:hypothetical protein
MLASGSPDGLSNFRGLLQGLKFIGLKYSLYYWKFFGT